MSIIKPLHPRAGASLIELLVVLGILSVLMSLYGWAIFSAFTRILAFIKSLQ